MTDPFDSLLVQSCTVLKVTATADAYGQQKIRKADMTSLADAVPCRVSNDAIGRPHELQAVASFSFDYNRVLMREPTLSDGSSLNTHHWLEIDGKLFNIFLVQRFLDASAVHHLEVIVEQFQA